MWGRHAPAPAPPARGRNGGKLFSHAMEEVLRNGMGVSFSWTPAQRAPAQRAAGGEERQGVWGRHAPAPAPPGCGGETVANYFPALWDECCAMAWGCLFRRWRHADIPAVPRTSFATLLSPSARAVINYAGIQSDLLTARPAHQT